MLEIEKKKNNGDIFYLKFHPRVKIDFEQNDQIKKIDKLKNQSFSKVLISQTSTLVYNFMNSKKQFYTLACDYRPSLTSSKIGKKA